MEVETSTIPGYRDVSRCQEIKLKKDTLNITTNLAKTLRTALAVKVLTGRGTEEEIRALDEIDDILGIKDHEI